MHYCTIINGIEVAASYSEITVNGILIPLLKHFSDLHTIKKGRILVMLAAPPGAGKSTLVCFLEHLAKDIIPEKMVQSVGMDGFHMRQDYLISHEVCVNGKNIPMVNVKGAPETFDLAGLLEIKDYSICKWPLYDRLLHNPIEDAITIDAEIVLLEGNYLLLDIDGWRELANYADYTISISADEELLRKRLIERRIATGVQVNTAEQFVDFSDMSNVRLCLEKTKKADLELELIHDGTEIIQR